METTSKTYYAGRYTAGISLIALGSLYIASLFTKAISLSLVLKLWPLMLIGVGTELLICAIRSKGQRIHYDWLSIVLMLLLASGSMLMFLFDFFINRIPAGI